MFVDMHLDESIRKKRNILRYWCGFNFSWIAIVIKTLFSYGIFLRRVHECLKIFVPFIFRCVHHFELSILHTRRTKLFTLFLAIEDIRYLFLSIQSIDKLRISSFFFLSYLRLYRLIVSILFFNIENLNGMNFFYNPSFQNKNYQFLNYNY